MKNTKNFSSSEFMCKCGCGGERMHQSTIDKLQIARDTAGVPFHVNSGYRCKKHNKAIGSKQGSSHPRGYAADLKIKGFFKATRNKRRSLMLFSLKAAGFNRFGLADRFIHVDDDPVKPANIIWLY